MNHKINASLKITQKITPYFFLLDSPVFLYTPRTVEVAEKSSTTINMTAEAYPENIIYLWSKDGSPLETADSKQRIMAIASILHIRNATREDSGVYHCVAENDEGQSKVAITLNVLCKFFTLF